MLDLSLVTMWAKYKKSYLNFMIAENNKDELNE